MFKDDYQKDNERISPAPETRARVLSAMKAVKSRPARAPRRDLVAWKRAGVAVACLLVALVGVFTVKGVFFSGQNTTVSPLPVNEEPVSGLSGYEEVYHIISNISYNNRYANTGGETGAVSSSAAAGVAEDTDGTAVEEAAPEDTAEITAQDKADFSGTNVQVEGIDEGDTVKTDGDYLYRLQDNTLSILACEGENTTLLSQTRVAEGDKESETLNGGTSANSEYAAALYLSGDYAAIIKNTYTWSEWRDPETDEWNGSSADYTTVAIYDVSDRSAPSLLTEFKQDGYYLSSRLSGGILYLISNDCAEDEPVEGEPETYVPCTYGPSGVQPVDTGCIYIVPNPDTTQYTVISAVELSTGAMIDNQSILGAGTEFYMSTENLYLARTVYDSVEGTPFMEDGYEVQEFQNSTRTELLRFSLQAGEITPAAEGEVPGYLLNQFSMDEYDGHLRIVTTISEDSYRTYTDKKHDWVNYQSGDSKQENALYILDSDLQITGKIDGLAEDERVYSVRFSGEVGYFVTFRETDPLFTVDLSDPTEPEIMSKLKIPGFSSYLHVYGDGLLFGLGMNADEETGQTNGMKLSMFDISDPYDVEERHTMYLDTDWSEALSNHKAILISPGRDLIAFPAESGYAIYGYSEKTGFYPKATVDSDLDWFGGDARGVYSGNYFYVCAGSAVTVFRLDTFSEAAHIGL